MIRFFSDEHLSYEQNTDLYQSQPLPAQISRCILGVWCNRPSRPRSNLHGLIRHRPPDMVAKNSGHHLLHTLRKHKSKLDSVKVELSSRPKIWDHLLLETLYGSGSSYDTPVLRSAKVVCRSLLTMWVKMFLQLATLRLRPYVSPSHCSFRTFPIEVLVGTTVMFWGRSTSWDSVGSEVRLSVPCEGCGTFAGVAILESISMLIHNARNMIDIL